MAATANPNVNTNSGYGPPTTAWYVRVDKDDTDLFGPLTWRDANIYARYQSKHNESGLSEIVTYVEGNIMVVCMMIRGRKTLNGKAARYSSARGIPTPF
jgi:hypothetical protein